MKTPRTGHEPLLEDLLSGEELEPLRAASLRQMIEAARRHQQRRQALRTVALTLAPALAALGLLAFYLPRWKPFHARQAVAPELLVEARPSASETLPGQTPISPRPEVVPARDSGVNIISDAELLALFPDRPVALIGPPGQQKLVFLDVLRGPNTL